MWKIKSVTFEVRDGSCYRCDQYTYTSGFKFYREAVNKMERKRAFVNKLEDLFGHEVKEMNAYDVLLYGRKFSVETYAKRSVNYAIRNNKNKKK